MTPSLRRLLISSKTFASLTAGALVFLAACSGTDVTSLDRYTRGEHAGDDDRSRDAAGGSRASAGSRTDSPSRSSSAATGPFFRAAADLGTFADFSLEDAVVGDDGAIRIAEGEGRTGTSPRPGYGSFYEGGEHRFAVATSPVWTAKAAFDSITPSFEASTPPGTWIEIKVSARVDGEWTKDYSLGVWAEDDGTVRRHSVDGQGDEDGDVATDTLELKRPADALRVTTVLFASARARSAAPTLRAVAAVATKKGAAAVEAAGSPAARGKILPVPQRSQLLYEGGSVWCSPTSTSMLLAYWADVLGANGLRETVPEAARKCHDHVYEGTGNWPFNTAHAAAMDGGRLHGAITRLSSFGQVEQLVAADIPVAISVRYGRGELSGSPIASTAGHIIVVRGFTENGDVVCNDPAFGSDAKVRVTYDRAELTRAWQRSLGTTYLIWPTDKSLPVDPAGAFF